MAEIAFTINIVCAAANLLILCLNLRITHKRLKDLQEFDEWIEGQKECLHKRLNVLTEIDEDLCMNVKITAGMEPSDYNAGRRDAFEDAARIVRSYINAEGEEME